MRSNKSTQHAHTHRHGAAGSAGNGTQLTSSAHLRLTTRIEKKLTRLDLLDVPSASSKEKISFDLVVQVLFGSVDSTEADPRHIPTDQLLRINDTLRAHHNDLLLDEAVQNMYRHTHAHTCTHTHVYACTLWLMYTYTCLQVGFIFVYALSSTYARKQAECTYPYCLVPAHDDGQVGVYAATSTLQR